jgi:hypothetical protein
MKKVNKAKNLLRQIKSANDELLLKDQRITISNQNKCFIQNYDEVLEIADNQIILKSMTIQGQRLKIVNISKYFIEISGTIDSLSFKERSE